MRIVGASLVGVCVSAMALSAGCNNSSSSAGSSNGATATPGASSSAAAVGSTTTTSALMPVTYDKGKFPAKGTQPVLTQAKKGGSGGTRPSPTSKRLSERGTDRQMRQPATVDMVDCTTTPDNAAECDGNSMYYCDDQKLWVVDCDAEAKHGGVAGGSCFEAETFTECLGCDTAADGSTECCDFRMSVCCDKDGACFTPTPLDPPMPKH